MSYLFNVKRRIHYDDATVRVIAGEIYRHNNNWKFAAKGIGLADGLNSICKSFGLLS